MVFFRLYDWDKDGAITENDIKTIVQENEHTLTDDLSAEMTQYFSQSI